MARTQDSFLLQTDPSPARSPPSGVGALGLLVEGVPREGVCSHLPHHTHELRNGNQPMEETEGRGEPESVALATRIANPSVLTLTSSFGETRRQPAEPTQESEPLCTWRPGAICYSPGQGKVHAVPVLKPVSLKSLGCSEGVPLPGGSSPNE